MWERRHMRERDAFVEDVPRFAVFERDDFICKICGYPIDMTLAAPHRKSASIDHVVPLARGGKHEMSNVQAAHFGCNARKGARVQVVA